MHILESTDIFLVENSSSSRQSRSLVFSKCELSYFWEERLKSLAFRVILRLVYLSAQ